MDWKNKVVLITGGTGSFGKKFIDVMLKKYNPAKLIIFSRDEQKQHMMRQMGFTQDNLRYFIGDVRDYERLRRAFYGVDFVI
ncbi:MAG: polysaccharide biosynthesis protein, partial [Anaerolineaceae bacterium]|nr:polysaccharide biosynthesis protein [Anaerolineaceae bacterium]